MPRPRGHARCAIGYTAGALDWVGRLEQTSLAEHLDEASTLLSAARAELGTSMANHRPVDPLLFEAATRQT